MKKIQKIIIIRKIIMSLVATVVLTWALFKNNLWAKIIIIPFIVCSISFLGQNVALLFNKEKISNVFKYIFRISFFVYVFGFLSYMVYYSIINKCYSILIVVAVFLIFAIYFIKKLFFDKDKNLQSKSK